MTGGENLRAIALMVAAMASFALSDLFIKYATRTLPVSELLLYMSLLGALIFAGLTLRNGLPVLSRLFFDRFVLLRNSAEVVGATCMLAALGAAPLSLVASVTQAMPLVVTAGAALFLGERVGPRRWIAVFIGLAGVLLILRPGAMEVTTGALFAIGATLGLGIRDVITRRVPRGIANVQLATYAFAVMIPVGIVLVALTPGTALPDAVEAAHVLGATLTAAVAYYTITAAMRIGDVSAVSPFRYTRLLFALLLAMVFLGERPDLLTLVGAAIVIGSGLFVLLRERQVARRTARNAAP